MSCHCIKLNYLALEESYKFFPIMFEKKLCSKMQLGMLYLLNRTISAYSVHCFIYCNEQNNSSYIFDNWSHVLKYYYMSQDLLLPLQAEQVKKG